MKHQNVNRKMDFLRHYNDKNVIENPAQSGAHISVLQTYPSKVASPQSLLPFQLGESNLIVLFLITSFLLKTKLTQFSEHPPRS